MLDDEPNPDDVELASQLQHSYRATLDEVAKRIVGQQDVIAQLIMAVLVRGHCLLEGVPGLGKTRIVRALADAMDMSFRRIQFTPDLMPSDITGSEVLQPDHEQKLQRIVIRGPVFTNVLLADEINRAPPKTQSALLEAMSEQQVTIGNETVSLPSPFFVLATQNPVEQEGTYPLPEAQLDRFVFKIKLDYPPEDDEIDIVRAGLAAESAKLVHQMSAEDVVRFQQLVSRVPVPDPVLRYAARLARATRPAAIDEATTLAGKSIEWGAGPRASICLAQAAQAQALVRGTFHATIEDVISVARPVLRHRIRLRFEAVADGLTPEDIVDQIVEQTPTTS